MAILSEHTVALNGYTHFEIIGTHTRVPLAIYYQNDSGFTEAYSSSYLNSLLILLARLNASSRHFRLMTEK